MICFHTREFGLTAASSVRVPGEIKTSQGAERETKVKNIFTNLMTSAALLFTIGGGLEAQSTQMHAKVPFAWQVNGQQLNAGDYVVDMDAASHVISLRNITTGKSIFVAVIPGSDKKPNYRLVFHRVGQRYFLAEVWAPDSASSELPVSSAEREAIQSAIPRQIATIFVDAAFLIN
jgi:hypothetical protein